MSEDAHTTPLTVGDALGRLRRDPDHEETAEERMTRLIPGKAYLGDGAYVQHAGWGTAITLTAENGVSVSDEIMLEPAVWRALQAYMVQLEDAVRTLATKIDMLDTAAEEKTT